MMKIKLIEAPTENDWAEAYRRALLTVGLKPIKPPDAEWRRSILRARHSPIRRLRFSFLLENIPSYVATHLARHVHAQPYIKSQRNDRQAEYDRNKAPQDAPVNMIWDLNAEELMTVFNKRLCMQADETTRKVVQGMKKETIEYDEMWEEFAVPMCEYLHTCNEMKPCEKGRSL